jgi:hypothetical protein
MATSRVDDVYRRYLRELSASERLQLLVRLATSLLPERRPDHAGTGSLLDLEGLGAELWAGIDADDYVRQLRSEWSPGGR